MNKQYLIFATSLVFSLALIVTVAKGPLPFGLMGKTFEIRESDGHPVATEDREKKLYIKFGYFAGDVTGYDGCNIFKASIKDLGLGQFVLDKVSSTKNTCRHHPYPAVRYKSLTYSDSGATLQFEPYGLGKSQKSLGLEAL